METKISIILPTYKVNLYKKIINSALKQTYDKFFLLKKLIKKHKKQNWTIGLYEGNPLFIKSNIKQKYPLFQYHFLNNIKVNLVADPFLVFDNNKFYLFFEAKDKHTQKGVIALASSKDLYSWNYDGVILREKYHISYPHIYKINNIYYMIPETGENNDVRLYKSYGFPFDWRFESKLLEGRNYADATLYKKDNYWYMFVSSNTHDVLELYISKSINGDFLPHPCSPIYTNEPKYSRCAGPIIEYNEQIIRYAQDCSETYGKQVYAFIIKDISPISFHEELYHINPILEPSKGYNWNSRKMHHVCPLKIDNNWVIAVDAQGYKW